VSRCVRSRCRGGGTAVVLGFLVNRGGVSGGVGRWM
jgi:hypothetical protein